MALTIRRGATRVFVIGLDGCTGSDYLWSAFDKTVVRLRQGSYYVDKELTIMEEDATAGLVHFTEEDTLPLNDTYKAQIQVASTKETANHELVVKSSEFEVVVLPSLWDDKLANAYYRGEHLQMIQPIIPSSSIHAVYEMLHINIKEYNGIIAERDEVGILEGEYLMYNAQSETLYSEPAPEEEEDTDEDTSSDEYEDTDTN